MTQITFLMVCGIFKKNAKCPPHSHSGYPPRPIGCLAAALMRGGGGTDYPCGECGLMAPPADFAGGGQQAARASASEGGEAGNPAPPRAPQIAFVFFGGFPFRTPKNF